MAETAKQNQQYANITPDIAAGDAGHLDDAVILCEGGIGKRADRRGDQAANAIREDPPFRRERNAPSSMACFEIRQLAVKSPTASRMQTSDTSATGKNMALLN